MISFKDIVNGYSGEVCFVLDMVGEWCLEYMVIDWFGVDCCLFSGDID